MPDERRRLGMHHGKTSGLPRGQLIDWWVLAGIVGGIGLLLAVATFTR